MLKWLSTPWTWIGFTKLNSVCSIANFLVCEHILFLPNKQTVSREYIALCHNYVLHCVFLDWAMLTFNYSIFWMLFWTHLNYIKSCDLNKHWLVYICTDIFVYYIPYITSILKYPKQDKGCLQDYKIHGNIMRCHIFCKMNL